MIQSGMNVDRLSGIFFTGLDPDPDIARAVAKRRSPSFAFP
jgi:hypothetical protein